MRDKTTQVKVGNIIIGGNNPIVVQSMTTEPTLNINATVAEAIRIYEGGAQLVRITAQGAKEAEALKEIKLCLNRKGYLFPISADIHFSYKAAYIAATTVDKIRINPGNFISHKNDKTFDEGIENIKRRLVPLLNLCKKNDVAMRIGVNHGSLSDRINIRYGDTPKGIVASCIEYLKICKEEDFHNVIISIKSSNTVMMIKSVRLLVKEMHKLGMSYPLHLGVTEAGEGEDGRLKSAAGIGTLLNQGLGSTIRVSLTEPPEYEPKVAEKIKRFMCKSPVINNLNCSFDIRKVIPTEDFSNDISPRVLIDTRLYDNISLHDLGYKTIRSCDYVLVNSFQYDFPKEIKQIVPSATFEGKGYPHYISLKEYSKCHNLKKTHFVSVTPDEKEQLKNFKYQGNCILILETSETNAFNELEIFFQYLEKIKNHLPTVVAFNSTVNDLEDFQIQSGVVLGNSFIDRRASGILLKNNQLPALKVRETAFGLLQATRVRTTKTEFISCPSCGRTLFNLQELTMKIKRHFQHLNHLKIAIMGCIVNGPGEMGDAHYGYVGSGKGRVTLYKGKEIMERNIPSEEAIKRLEALIKEHGDWIDE